MLSGADGRKSRPTMPRRFRRRLFGGAQDVPAQSPNLDRVRVLKPEVEEISGAAGHEQPAESWRSNAIGWVKAQEARVFVSPGRLER